MRFLLLWLCLLAWPLCAQDRLRVATFNVGLGREGPGLLLKDILSNDEDITAVIQIIGAVDPDILLLTNFDDDYQHVAAQAFLTLLNAQNNQDYITYFGAEGNAGIPSGLDLDGNGFLNDWADNWGFGKFPGHENMILLSKYPIESTQTHHQFLWRDLPNAVPPKNPDGSDFLTDDAWQDYRLAYKDFWDLHVVAPNGPLRVLASHASPPVFDGPENLNGLRNDAEVAFWRFYLDQNPDLAAQDFVILADLNADPFDGEGMKSAVNILLADPRINDVNPSSAAGVLASDVQKGVNLTQIGNPATDTADWADEKVGNLRVDYVLPSTNLGVIDAGVFWPLPDTPEAAWLETAGTAHRLVWVDILLTP